MTDDSVLDAWPAFGVPMAAEFGWGAHAAPRNPPSRPRRADEGVWLPPG